ncbi:MAG TPA: hypothetical protein VMU00_02385 [Steroidobacteraceae bacterium]|nr:hypothetical protein [Steroidobacteraceae bacterium]
MKCAVLGAGLLCGVAAFAGPARAQLTNPPPSRPLSAYGAFELRPAELDAAEAREKGKAQVAGQVQQQLDALVAPIVAGWNQKPPLEGAPRLVISPRIDIIKKVSGTARVWSGAWAGDSYITMHVRFVEQPGDTVVAEPRFHQRASAVSGAWTFGGQDKDMLRRIAQLIADYLQANYDAAVGGPTGEPK